MSAIQVTCEYLNKGSRLPRRERDDALVQHPIAGISASILDADLAVGAVLPEVKGGTTLARVAQRGAYAAGAVGATAGVLATQGSANPMTDTEKTWAYLGMGLSGIFVPSARSVAASAAKGTPDNIIKTTTKTTAYDVLDEAQPPITRSKPTTLPDDILQRGKPYSSRSSAQTALQAKKITKTHGLS